MLQDEAQGQGQPKPALIDEGVVENKVKSLGGVSERRQFVKDKANRAAVERAFEFGYEVSRWSESPMHY